MIQNAKDYNNSESSVYANAEKIRKLTLNFMKLNNPAYQQDPNYVSHATPAPPKGEVAGDPEKTQQKKPSGKIRLNTGRSASAAGQTPAAAQMDGAEEQNEKPQGAEASTRDAAQDAPADSGKESKFEGKIFQEAQEQIMDQMIHYHDEDGWVAVISVVQPMVTDSTTAILKSSNHSSTSLPES